MRTTIQTPLGDLKFVVTLTVGEEASDYTAICQHPGTGTMALARVKKEEGGGFREATASSARDVILIVQLIFKAANVNLDQLEDSNE